MRKYKIIDVENDRIVTEGYAREVVCNTEIEVSQGILSSLSKTGKLYFGKYQIIDLGDDGVKPEKKTKKELKGYAKTTRKSKKNNELERINEIARSFQMSYGQFVSWLEFHPTEKKMYGIK